MVFVDNKKARFGAGLAEVNTKLIRPGRNFHHGDDYERKGVITDHKKDVNKKPRL